MKHEEIECTCGKDDLYGVMYHPHAKWCLKEQEVVEVAPGIYQSKEDYEANMAYDGMKDNQLT